MNEQFKVTIIVAIYNVDLYIKKCINSIINQDYTNLEIILVDDCSTDSSGNICDEFKMKDSRVKVIHHISNTKQAGVRNDGLKIATGDYIVFVDGDDWLAEDFVSYMLKVIISTNSDMAINLVNFTTRDLIQTDNGKIEVWSAEKATAELLFPHVTVGCWNKIYKRDFIEKYHLRFKTHLFTAEGDRFINEAAQRANQVGVGTRKVYYYRLNNTDSATTKYDIRQSMGAISAFVELEKDLIIKTPYVLNALTQHKWLNHLWNLRQILVLNLKKNYTNEFKESLLYVKSNFLSVVRGEPNIEKKIKYLIIGLFPIISSKILTYRFNSRLKKDVQNFNNDGI
ncbi:MAG: glycosyltransferase family 2 protein [Beduini sp.]|uniref:glycosyltransferase family 2 protein n=1 Tax=Beduini sp. TaxID=1922300 RepID=UPI0039A16288